MRARKLLTLTLIAVVVVLTTRYLFWNDTRDVRRRVEAIAKIAGAPSGETAPEREARGAQLGTFATDDVIIRTDSAAFVGGRPAVVRFVLDGAATYGQMKLSVDDVQVERIDPTTATVFLTLSIFGDQPRVADPLPRQLHATFSKINGEWLLSRGEVLRTLETSK